MLRNMSFQKVNSTFSVFFFVSFSIWQILKQAYFFTPKLRDSARQLSPGASNCEFYGGDGRLRLSTECCHPGEATDRFHGQRDGKR